MGWVLQKKKPELIISIVVTGMLLIITSSAMYYVEHPTQQEAFSSIPATLWWGFVTLSTVGYGDIFPVTPLGRLLAGISAFLGVGLFALPASILASGFIVRVYPEDSRAGTASSREIISLSRTTRLSSS